MAGSNVQVTFHWSRVPVTVPWINYQTTNIALVLNRAFCYEIRARRHFQCCSFICIMMTCTLTCGIVTCILDSPIILVQFFFFKSLVLTQPPRRRPLGFVCRAFISPPGTSAKHSRHLCSPITDRLPIFVKRNPNRFLRFARSVRLLIGCARNLCF